MDNSHVGLVQRIRDDHLNVRLLHVLGVGRCLDFGLLLADIILDDVPANWIHPMKSGFDRVLRDLSELRSNADLTGIDRSERAYADN